MNRTLLLVALIGTSGCSVRKLATGALADALSGTGTTMSSDNDPELVRDASAFGLKTMEGLLPEQPEHLGLITSLTSGFTQYGYAFVQQEADAAELAGKGTDARARRLRAHRFYKRALGYGLKGLELRAPGCTEALKTTKGVPAALAPLTKEDVSLVYWTAAAWALAITSNKEDMELISQLPAPEALVRRALELDEAWGDGNLHEFMVSLEASKPGGSEAAAKKHFDRAVELAKGQHLGVYLSWAEGPLVQAQKKDEFIALVKKVAEANVDESLPNRLANTVAQRRARVLLAHTDDLFN
jgi:TRAP transporter T-component